MYRLTVFKNVSYCTRYTQKTRKNIIIKNIVKTGGNGDDEIKKKYNQFMQNQINTLKKSFMLSSYDNVSIMDFREIVMNKWGACNSISLEIKNDYIILTVDKMYNDNYDEIVNKLNELKIAQMIVRYVIDIPREDKRKFPINIRIPIPKDNIEWS